MEDLSAPPVLIAIRELSWRMHSGSSMKEALRLYLEIETSLFSHHLREWWALRRQERPFPELSARFPSHYQRALLTLIERGCAGQPTLDHLAALESEVEAAAQAELESHIQTLPLKVLMPLLLFQFPAFLLLLLGPLLRELEHHLGGG